MKIALYGKTIDGENQKTLKKIIEVLKSRDIEYLVHANLKEALESSEEPVSYYSSFHDLNNSIDFLLSIGGDGTFLDTILLVRNLDIPLLGINTGRLGFLSNTPTNKVETSIDALLSGDYSVEKRSLLKLDSQEKLFGENNHALNEISILKSDTSSMITVHTKLNGVHLNSYWTDGLIISTATGSTAYSLSCGGPIIMPGSGNFVITPIAPHNLNVRPIVVDDDAVLTLTVEGRSERNLVALDSRSKDLQNGVELTIRKAKYTISIVQFKDQTFITSLKNKLNWGLDQRNT